VDQIRETPTVTPSDDPSDDQTRLRWLREDLTSCLGEISAILRRASGDFAAPNAAHIEIDVPESSSDASSPAAEAGEPPDPSGLQVPPASITWTWADGAAMSYDWQNRAIRWQRPP
jgi:hypothetical protein